MSDFYKKLKRFGITNFNEKNDKDRREVIKLIKNPKNKDLREILKRSFDDNLILEDMRVALIDYYIKNREIDLVLGKEGKKENGLINKLKNDINRTMATIKISVENFIENKEKNGELDKKPIERAVDNIVNSDNFNLLSNKKDVIEVLLKLNGVEEKDLLEGNNVEKIATIINSCTNKDKIIISFFEKIEDEIADLPKEVKEEDTKKSFYINNIKNIIKSIEFTNDELSNLNKNEILSEYSKKILLLLGSLPTSIECEVLLNLFADMGDEVSILTVVRNKKNQDEKKAAYDHYYHNDITKVNETASILEYVKLICINLKSKMEQINQAVDHFVKNVKNKRITNGEKERFFAEMERIMENEKNKKNMVKFSIIKDRLKLINEKMAGQSIQNQLITQNNTRQKL